METNKPEDMKNGADTFVSIGQAASHVVTNCANEMKKRKVEKKGVEQ
jgi:hypothetical protein